MIDTLEKSASLQIKILGQLRRMDFLLTWRICIGHTEQAPIGSNLKTEYIEISGESRRLNET
jgi:hypothetical protein